MSTRSCCAWVSCSLLFVAAVAPAGEVADHADFTGRTEAAVTVDVRARVTGYLAKVSFKEGEDVKQGDLLFEIDPRPYQAELARADAGLASAEAHLKRVETDLKR